MEWSKLSSCSHNHALSRRIFFLKTKGFIKKRKKKKNRGRILAGHIYISNRLKRCSFSKVKKVEVLYMQIVVLNLSKLSI
jgi:hypothetical protein